VIVTVWAPRFAQAVAAGACPGHPGQHWALEGPAEGFLSHPRQSDGKNYVYPTSWFWQQKQHQDRESLDSRSPQTRKFQAATKIVAGLLSCAPSSHTTPPLHYRRCTPGFPHGLNDGGSGRQGQGLLSLSHPLNLGARWILHLLIALILRGNWLLSFIQDARNKWLTFVAVGQKLN
jgi:hypothetical protein